ncbi:MAG TPA: hypothetical protein HPP66_00510 [Planctomycetes bacterium]|nr:hypothetical protein [Planctomycetota bacterium]
MKKNSADVIIKKLTMCLFVWLLTIALPSASNGSIPKVDFHDLAIFARYWLETECNAANNWCNSPHGHEIPNGDEATPGATNVDCQQPW